MRPRAINLFEKLGWAASALGGVSVFVMFIQMLTQRVVTGAAPYFLMLFVLLLFGALAFLTYYASRRRHELGRSGVLVTAAVIAVLLVTRIDGIGVGGEGMALLYLVLDMATLGCLMGAAIYLLHSEAQAWFALGPIAPAPRPVAAPYPGYGAPGLHSQYPGQPGAGQPSYPPQDPSQPVYPPAQPYPPAQGQPAYPPEGVPPGTPGQPPYPPAQ